ncbi:MAG: hypothetical protein DVB32_03650 [Verrucomicrobia bacterium]|nr:MAG: hypothetical protein DVB32_03650 [Verrucomicrobiota bacterium]
MHAQLDIKAAKGLGGRVHFDGPDFNLYSLRLQSWFNYFSTFHLRVSGGALRLLETALSVIVYPTVILFHVRPIVQYSAGAILHGLAK